MINRKDEKDLSHESSLDKKKVLEKKRVSALIRTIQNNSKDNKSFEELYNMIWNKAFYYCLRHLRSEEDAKDAVQEIMVVIYKSIGNIRNPDAFYSFLYKVMIGVCAANYKNEKFSSNEIYDIDDVSNDLPETNHDFLPESAVTRKETREYVLNLVDRLPEKQRQAVLLYYFEGLKQKEIGELTDSEIGAVNRRLVAARKSLQKQVDSVSARGDTVPMFSAVPVLTQIFNEDARAVCTDEIRDRIWENISENWFDKVHNSDKNDKQNNKKSKKNTDDKSKYLNKIKNLRYKLGILALSVAVLVMGGVVYKDIKSDFENTPNTAQAQQENLRDEIVQDLLNVISETDFESFIQKYSILNMTTEKYENGKSYIFMRKNIDKEDIWIGFCVENTGEYLKTYKFVEKNKIIPDNIAKWFTENKDN